MGATQSIQKHQNQQNRHQQYNKNEHVNQVKSNYKKTTQQSIGDLQANHRYLKQPKQNLQSTKEHPINKQQSMSSGSQDINQFNSIFNQENAKSIIIGESKAKSVVSDKLPKLNKSQVPEFGLMHSQQKQNKQSLSQGQAQYDNQSNKFISIKNQINLKIGVFGIRSAVGKTTLIKSFKEQQILKDDSNLTKTIGTEVYFLNYDISDLQVAKVQLWVINQIEFESNDQGFSQWYNVMNKSFDYILMVFDEFNEICANHFKQQVLNLQEFLFKLKLTGKIKITLVGNDRLNMTISGKDQIIQYLTIGRDSDIEKSLLKIYDGNKIDVKIIDFKQLKEINRLFKDVIQYCLTQKQTKN